VYSAEIGNRELTGHNDGPVVKKYLTYCGLSEGAEWCSAFVSWCFKEAGIKTLRTAWSPGWYSKSRLLYKKGDSAPKYQPKAGDVVLYWVPYKKRVGHVGFFDKYGDQYCETVEGNTRIGNIQGVHRIKRYWTSFYAILNYCD
jgi:cell wall-associated NlpC family hydrolase